MRITKYRGKREYNGEWVYGAFYPIKDEDVSFIINNCKSIDFDDDDTTFNGYKVHKKSVGEFTGLYDKNGKEIYEGDLIKIDGSNETWEILWLDAGLTAFTLDRRGLTNSLWRFPKTIEIIGNVFENPDLVKL